MKKNICIILAALALIWSAGCAAPAETTAQAPEAPALEVPAEETAQPPESCRATIEVENYGVIELELDGTAAPETVANFISLAESGFYDGLTFHRIMEGFMIQGGDPLGNGTGGTDKKIKGEFADNGHDNPISHVRGVISMARAADFDSASCQFFIVHQDSVFLDGQYAAFGRVSGGIEVVDAICADARPLDNNGSIAPEAQPVIKSVTIER